MQNITKVAVEWKESKSAILFDLDKTKGIEEAIQNISKKLIGSNQSSNAFGLKWKRSKKSDEFTDRYITKTLLSEVQDGDQLILSLPINHYLKNLKNGIKNDNMREIAFKELKELCLDPAYIEEMVLHNIHNDVFKFFLDKDPNDLETTAILMTITHLFYLGYVSKATPNFLPKIIKLVQEDCTNHEAHRYGLACLKNILREKNSAFANWKEMIVTEVKLKHLSKYFEERDRHLHLGALHFINVLIRSCKKEKRINLIREFEQGSCKSNIANKVIASSLPMNDELRHALYVAQTNILSIYKEALMTQTNITDNENLIKEFELEQNTVTRMTTLMDFEENVRMSSIQNLQDFDEDARVSLASILSDMTISDRSGIRNSEYSDGEQKISLLAIEALRHYKSLHQSNFYQSQIEERIYRPGIFVTSEKIVHILAKIFHIGRRIDNNCTLFQPLIFISEGKKPFFMELFSRTMWLVSKTRKEMKATTLPDYPKVLLAVEKQIRLVLEKAPTSYKSLTEYITEITFQDALEEYQLEFQKGFKHMLNTNPCIQEIKDTINAANLDVIFEQRICFLHKGCFFPQVIDDKRTENRIHVKLSKNNRQIIISEYDRKSETPKVQTTYNISDITHIVVGENCSHKHLSFPMRVFSIIIENSTKFNFIAESEKSAAYWIDALNFLMGKRPRSSYFEDELNELNDMDITLRLLELQHIELPVSAPEVPPLPKPRPPEKPNKLRKKSTFA